jgi:hypothetical protein
LAGSVELFTSQPSLALLLQSRKPVVHSEPQLPLEHTEVVLGWVGHTWLHVPQLFGSYRGSTHVEPHSTSGDAQLDSDTHWLPEHVVPGAHAFPHVPQLALSVCRSAQKAEEPVPHASGVGLGQEQEPLTQSCPKGQTFPQAPQLLTSFDSLAQ